MKFDQPPQSVLRRRWISLAAIIAAGLLFAVLKFNGARIDQTLWGEDGNIFINQARELGFTSLWVTYAGYFHLYPRLIAWLSSFLDLQITPLIFLSAWFLAYVTLIYVAASRALHCEFNPVGVGLLVILMLAQPHEGEVFFTLTNAQWFIGGALAIYVLVPIKDRSSIYEKGMLLVASLTGPFALVLSPILLMHLAIYKDWNDRKYVYILIGSGALAQFAAIFLSNRLTDGGFDKDIIHWVRAIFNFMSFGSTSAISLAASILFWATMAYAFAVNLGKNLNRHYDSTGVITLSLLTGAVFFYGAGMLAVKPHPHWLSPLGYEARYFIIPYFLVFFAAWLVVSKQPKLRFLIYVALTILAISSFTMYNRNDLQFKSYAEFARIKSDVLIPLQPQLEDFPSWHIRLPENSDHLKRKSVDAISLILKDAKMLNVMKSDEKYQKDGFVSLNEDPQISFDIGERCSHARYLGVEIHITRPEGGWVQLFWSESEKYSEHQSLRRYYPAGDAAVQFALPMENVKYLRFDPLEKRSQFQINSVRVYCLEN